ncbi:flavin monoamine oxidase family protein [Sphingomonas agri]|uniref:flavin monoamine oxidase family protein n=1 Tax=Sphingomonas agri TaxID=1813878 RepID=UPI00311F14A3
MSGVRGLVIIGGGAAGIGAAMEAGRRSIDALIVEALDRLGGRAHSIEWNGHKLDLGCTWMHSAERNSLRVEAERIGAQINRSPTRWFQQFRNLGFPPEEQKEAWSSFEALRDRMRSDPPPSDRASDALEGGDPWNPMLNALSGYINGAPLDEVSIADWSAYDNAASDQNLRLPGSYGSLIGELGATFERSLANPVIAVGRRKEGVEVRSEQGLIEAAGVIVTVPTASLRRIRFDPPIGGLLKLADQLPLGVADKLFLALDHPQDFPHDAHLLGNPYSCDTGSYFIRPMGMPVVEGFFGGTGARALEELDDDGAAALAIEELAALLGSSVRSRLSLIGLSRWAHQPWIGGAYSHALPGCADARQSLLDAGDDRIAFAGEAVSAGDYSTAHGAFDSGAAAVRKLAATAKLQSARG